MASRSLRVLVAGASPSDAETTARALERAAGSIGREIEATATTDPDTVSESFDCLVSVGPADTDVLRRSFSTVPLIRYLDPETLSREEIATENVVQRAGEGSGVVLARRIAAVAGDRRQVVPTVEQIEEAVFVLDADWRCIYLNDDAEALLDRGTGTLLGENIWEVFQAGVGSRFYDNCHQAMRTGKRSAFEASLPGIDRHLEVEAYPDGERLVVHLRDVTDRKRREDVLSAVLETTRALMQARTRTEVAELLASAAKNTFEFEYNVVRLYDAETETLVPVDSTDAVADSLDERPVYGIDEGVPGEVFRTGEARRLGDVAEIENEAVRDALGSAMYLPIGVHGTISIGSTDPDAFDETDQQIAEILATNAAVAFSRAKREQEAREARNRVETLLERINGLVEETIEVLVGATTREEIETGVCERFTAASPFTFAWLGTADVAGETLTASVWEGEADLDVADYELDLTAEEALDPSGQALQQGEPVVVNDLPTLDDEWARAAVESGLASLCAVPLTYKDTVYGVLTVYADQTAAIDERERVVLAALGRAIADAINAIERGRILSTNRVIEMELTSRDPDLLFSRLSAQADCRIESTGTLYQADGSLNLYLRAETGDADTVRDIMLADDAIAAVTHVVSHEGESLFEVTATESVVETLAEFGAVTKHVAGEDGITRLTIELPYETEARETYDRLAERYEGLDLVGYHEHDRPVQTRQEFRAALRERFTDRQETALRSAYLGGFFEWPRQVDGDDLAGAMGITRPTYHQHLRAAERKVFEELF